MFERYSCKQRCLTRRWVGAGGGAGRFCEPLLVDYGNSAAPGEVVLISP